MAVKKDQQQDSEFEFTHNSVISGQETEDTSQITDKLESTSAQESVILEQKTLQLYKLVNNQPHLLVRHT